MVKRFLKLRNIRRFYSIFFFSLFITLLLIADVAHIKGYEVSLFLELDPLVSISSFLTSATVYKGLILSLIVLIPTIFLGRFFCSWICPMGILNQWISDLFNRRRKKEEMEINAYRPLFRIKYYILAILTTLALTGSLQIGLFDPIALITRSFVISFLPLFNFPKGLLYLKEPLFSGGILISLLFIIIVYANRFLTRFWCRVACPLGALLGILSSVALFRIWRNVEKCTDCKKCLSNCNGGCDPHMILRYCECHLCMNCIEDCPEEAIHYGLPDKTGAIHRGVDVNRRRVVEAAIGGIVLYPLLRTSVSSATSPIDKAIRPPGSLMESDFLKRCIKCGECMKICPTNGLQPALLETGLEGLWTPVLNNRIGYCEYNCILCGSICPTGAIRELSVPEKTGRGNSSKALKIGTAFYERGRCLPWSMNIECIVCEEACPTSPKAIWFQKVETRLRSGEIKTLKRPLIDTSLCTGCGICENKCPLRDRPAVRVTPIGETRSLTNKLRLTS